MNKILLSICLFVITSNSFAWHGPNPFVIQTRAEQGDPEAMYILGTWRFGQDVPTAKSWFEKVHQKGYAPAYKALLYLHHCKNYFNSYGFDYSNFPNKNPDSEKMIKRMRFGYENESLLIYDPFNCKKGF